MTYDREKFVSERTNRKIWFLLSLLLACSSLSPSNAKFSILQEAINNAIRHGIGIRLNSMRGCAEIIDVELNIEGG